MRELSAPLRAALVAATHLAVVAAIDMANDVLPPAELRLGLIFVPVVLSATAFGGLLPGLLVAGAATLSLHFANEPFVSTEASIVNGAIRIGVFLAVAFLADRVTRQTTAMRDQQRDLEREMAIRAEYTTLVAHELRNPLISIKAAARTLGRHPDPSAMADGIESESGAALELLDSLSDVASIEAGRMRSALQRMDLADLVRSVVAAADREDHEVRLTAAPQAVAVLGDPHRLAQVLKNLIGNAVKYSPPGTRIDVTLGVNRDRTRAVVTVRDHGPGIPPPERGRLFQKFARLSTAGGTRGSGLGLYICREIVRDHDGELNADWPSGGGSVFSFELPALGSRADDVDAAQRVPARPPALERRRRSS